MHLGRNTVYLTLEECLNLGEFAFCLSVSSTAEQHDQNTIEHHMPHAAASVRATRHVVRQSAFQSLAPLKHLPELILGASVLSRSKMWTFQIRFVSHRCGVVYILNCFSIAVTNLWQCCTWPVFRDHGARSVRVGWE